MKIKQLVALANNNVADFSIRDWSVFKATMMLFGVIIGCSFSDTCRNLRPVLFALWLAGIIYLLKRVYNLPVLCGRGNKNKLTLEQKAPAYTDQTAE